jgi:hypothetical protein
MKHVVCNRKARYSRECDPTPSRIQRFRKGEYIYKEMRTYIYLHLYIVSVLMHFAMFTPTY